MTTALDFTPEMARLLAEMTPVDHDGPAPDERPARVVWSHLAEPGDSAAGRLVAALGPAEALVAVVSDRVIETDELTARELAEGRKRWRPRLSRRAVHDALELAVRSGVRVLVPGDADWPDQLHDLGRHGPHALWVRGDPAALTRLRPSVAIVGARAATSYGEHVAVELASELAASGIPVISGAAYGIDGAAHRAALAVGGPTVALLAGGVDRSYPVGHAPLIDRIARAGAVLSEVPCGATPTKWRFLQRNRLIACLSAATVVVEAGWRSGSLNTTSHASELGRPIGAVPGPVTSAASAGCHKLLRENASCVTSADDVRELLGMTGFGAAEPRSADARPPTDDSTRVRDALSTRTWREGDDIARRSGMSPAHVEAVLGLLLLSGEVERSLVGWRRTRSDRA